jgi:cytochrome c553
MRYCTLAFVLCLAGIAAWLHGSATTKPAVRYQPMQYSTQTWAGSTYWTGGEWLRVGKDWQHPEQGAASIRRFDLPADGKVVISGHVAKADAGGGDGVLVEIRLDERTLWKAHIAATDLTGQNPNLSLAVKKGQSLSFVVMAGAGIICDGTRWDPCVTYADGARHQASAAFGQKQGAGGWFYEFEMSPGAAPPAAPSASAPPTSMPSVQGLDMAGLAELEWKLEDRISSGHEGYVRAIRSHLARTRQLLADLRTDRPADFLADEDAQLKAIEDAAGGEVKDPRGLYLKLRQLKRRIVLANPLMNFGPMLFAKRMPPGYSHLVMQHFGWRQRAGGGLFVLDRPGQSLQARDILEGKLAGGSVLEPSLSYDGKRIVFSWVELKNVKNGAAMDGQDVNYFHIFTVNVDGSDLRQVTSGPYDDLMPTWLPDGGIAFSSTRRKGYARCFGGQFGSRWHVYTLHRVQPDGTGLRTLSYHDTNEWYPTVTNSGHLLYARWDYIDRDAVTHQNLWLTRPDGTNPLALWGNAVPNPHCAFQARPVPESNKIVFIASAHHSVTGGSVVMLDADIHNNDHRALRRLTPAIRFPEAEGGISDWYCSPWPLSEKYFLISYSPLPLRMEPAAQPANGLGIYVLDVFGNREVIYRDDSIGSTSPIPFRPRASPPILPPASSPAGPTGAMLLSDVYQGMGDVPRGTIKELRIVQIFPKTTPIAGAPVIGCAGEENPRAILGTVPIEPDGSAYFELPAGKPVLFQALTADGMAYQTMRTLTYVQGGERVSCVGCHESRTSAVPPRPPLAAKRPPSRIEPGPMGGAPFSFIRFVQPVLDKNCVTCHGGDKTEKGINLKRTHSYQSLTKSPRLVPRYAARNQVQITPPGGQNAALGSGLIKMLRAGHNDVKLSDDEMRRLAAWIDMNAVFLGSCSPADNAKELKGEPIDMPEIQ